MSHASHQAHEQARRDQRHADIRDKPEDTSKSPAHADQTGKQLECDKHDKDIKGTAPAAPPKHEDEAFDVFEGNAPQSDG